MTEIRGILFDKDGTLLDFDATWTNFAQELTTEAAGGDHVEATRLLAAIGFNFETFRFEPGSIFAAGTNAEVIAAIYPQLEGADLRARIEEADRRAALAGAVPLPGIIETIHLLHRTGYRLGVATNDSALGASHMLQSFGLTGIFDAAYGYDSVKRPKPAPDVVHAFAAALSLHTEQIAMVGDNVHDLVTGRNAGAGLVVGVLSGNSRYEDLAPLADLVIESVVDLPEAILRL